MNIISKFVMAAVVVGGAASMSFPAQAHHAINSQFNTTKQLTFSAVLTGMVIRAPHPFWTFKDDKGNVWKLESAAPATLRRSGMRLKEDIVQGNRYEVFFAPSRDGTRTGLLTSLRFAGKRYDFNPDYTVPKS